MKLVQKAWEREELATVRRLLQDIKPSPAYIETLLPSESYGWAPLFGLRTDRWKLISGAYDELFMLTEDPAEKTNLLSVKPDIKEALQVDLEFGLGQVNLEVDQAAAAAD